MMQVAGENPEKANQKHKQTKENYRSKSNKEELTFIEYLLCARNCPC